MAREWKLERKRDLTNERKKEREQKMERNGNGRERNGTEQNGEMCVNERITVNELKN